jgi:formylglycine-generating enzyme
MIYKITAFSSFLFLMITCAAPGEPAKAKNSESLDAGEKIKESTTIVDRAHACPSGMVEVQGNYCQAVQQECLQWVDSNGVPTDPPINTSGRCGKWKDPVKCLTKPISKHFCIDQYEYPNQKGQIPQDWMSWYDVKSACESNGKRMCTRSEWTFAAEGPNMHPYPFGDGFHRDRTICNFDNHAKVDVFKSTNKNTPEAIVLHDMLVPSGSKPDCVSGWGVHDMSGNIDEWVINESHDPYVSGLMGGHVFGVRNASRPMTDAHGPGFLWYETGGRCCKDTE